MVAYEARTDCKVRLPIAEDLPYSISVLNVVAVIDHVPSKAGTVPQNSSSTARIEQSEHLGFPSKYRQPVFEYEKRGGKIRYWRVKIR